jgi:quercetin dioxygenase-like cupin family protein
MTHPRPLIVQPDTGTDLYAFGEVLSVLLNGKQTEGALTLMFDLIPLGGSSPVHVHSHEDVLFLVVDGRISYFVLDNWTEVEAGGAVYLPRGNVHAYRNVGITPSHHWILSLPSGLEAFFERYAEEFGNLGGPDLKRIVEIGREQGPEVFEQNYSARTRNHEN